MVNFLESVNLKFIFLFIKINWYFLIRYFYCDIKRNFFYSLKEKLMLYFWFFFVGIYCGEEMGVFIRDYDMGLW